jgi:CheY-like chemotaxis protein
VDDEPAVRESAVRILENGGYSVLSAASAGDALLICEETTAIDALVTDLVIHDMPGDELVERIEASGRDLSVVFISGYGDRGEAYQTNHPRVEKPFTAYTLLRVVGDSLAGEQRLSERGAQ